MKSDSTCEIRELADLCPLLKQAEGFSELAHSLSAGKTGGIEGAWGSARALAIAALADSLDKPLLIVVPRPPEMDELAVDLQTWLSDEPEIFSAWQTLPREHSMADPIFGSRLRVLNRLAGDDPPAVLLTTISALMQPVPTRAALRESVREIAVGEELDTNELLDWLIGRGFERVTLIEEPGEFRVHGGIIDIFPPDALDPIRIELFGDEIDSLRKLDVGSQRSLEAVD